MSKIVHHIVRISRRSYPTIQQFLDNKQLTIIPDAKLQHDKFNGLLYQPSEALLASQRPLNPQQLQLAHHVIDADLYRLPSAEALALLSQPGVQCDLNLNPLSLALRQTTSAAEAQDLLQYATPELGISVPLICPTRFQAQWQPQETLIATRGKEWFLVLFFDLALSLASPHPPTDTVAIDIGLSPLVNACFVRRNQDMRIENPVSPHLSYLFHSLPSQQQETLQQILYAWHRAELERLIDTVTMHARQVYAEEFTYNDLHKSFLTVARRYGLFDFHESWLHQRLQVCGIPFERVWPNGTSQRCHICPDHPYGIRSGGSFYCPRCGTTLDSHANASRNIARRGDKKRALLQQQARYSRSLQLSSVAPTSGQPAQ